MAELTYRTRRILYATITEYIATGEPVGSRRLAKGYGIELSPATIRNVLSDLEDAGFLAQPHTSAGRVPTDKGFRVFVDALVQMREVPDDDRAAILQRLKNLEPGTDVLKEAGELLSALTGAAALITAPRPEEERLAQLRFMPLREGQLLAVLVTTTGAIQNRVVRVEDPVDERQLERVNNLLAETLQDGASSLVGMRDSLAKEMEQQRDVAEDARAIIAAVMNETTPTKMVIEGQGRLFDRPEFVDADKIPAIPEGPRRQRASTRTPPGNSHVGWRASVDWCRDAPRRCHGRQRREHAIRKHWCRRQYRHHWPDPNGLRQGRPPGRIYSKGDERGPPRPGRRLGLANLALLLKPRTF